MKYEINKNPENSHKIESSNFYNDYDLDGVIKLEQENESLKEVGKQLITSNNKLTETNSGWVSKVVVNEQTINGLLKLDDKHLRQITELKQELDALKYKFGECE